MEDLKEDETREFKTTDNGYYFSSDVNYPNNKALVRQNVYLDKEGKVTKAEVVDKEGNVQIMMKFTNITFNKKFDKNHFELSNLLKNTTKAKEQTPKEERDTNINNTNDNTNNNTNNNTNDTNNESTDNNTQNTDTNNNTENNATNNSNTTNENKTTTDTNQNTTTQDSTQENNTPKTENTARIDDVLYPMYLPDNTYLTSQETVDIDNGQRLILTFGGDSSFILVEETINYSEEGLVIPVSGEFDFLSDVIGVIGTNSVTWHSNGIEYYMASNTVASSELVEIARSISVLPVSK